MDAYEALLRARAARGRSIVTVLCGGVAGLSILALAEAPPASRSPAETAEMRAAARIAAARQTIAIAEKEAAEEQALFADAILAASEIPHSPSGVPCGLTFPEPTHLATGKQNFPLLVVAKGDRRLPSPSIATVLADIERAKEHLDNGHFMDGILYANALEAKTRLRHDVVLVTTRVKPPLRTSASSFEPGEIDGRAYVYDFTAHRVTCAGDIHASSSRQVEYAYVPGHSASAALDPHADPYSQGPSLTASLDGDLRVQVQRAIAGGALFAIGSADHR